MAQKPTQMTPGLFGFDVPIDGKLKMAPSHKHKKRDDSENPMVMAYGRHPDPKLRCKDCDSLYVREYSRRYYKCMHRKDTAGAATDHRKHWPACQKFEEFDSNKTHKII